MKQVLSWSKGLITFSTLVLLFCLVTLSNTVANSSDPQRTGLIPMTEEEKSTLLKKHGVKVEAVALNELGLSRVSQGKRGLAAETMASQIALPVSVDNSTLKYFPPIRHQDGLGSCVAFSIAYYQLSYYFAKKYDWDQKNQDDTKKFSPKWLYNLINGGTDGGSSFGSAYPTLLKHGCATWAEFPYYGSRIPETNYRGWSDDPAVWRNALNFRVDNYIPYLESDAQKTDSFLRSIKELLVNGEILIFGTWVYSWQLSPIGDNPNSTEDDSEHGKNGVTHADGYEGGHAMTIVGYNDDIWIDVNGNGDIDTGELGALRVANSWGIGYEDSGFVWVAYDAIRPTSLVINGPNPPTRSQIVGQNDLVFFIRPLENPEPRMLAEVTLNHAKRDEIFLNVNVNNVPNAVWYPPFFGNGPYAFDGTTTARPFTFVFDVSSLIEENFLDNSQAYDWVLYVGDDRETDPVTVESFVLTDVQGGSVVTAATGLPQSYEAEGRDFFINYQLGTSTTNYPPMVDAGDFQYVSHPVSVVGLSGRVEDDGLPQGQSLSYEWTCLEGPGEVIFSDPTELETNVTLTFGGTYKFRLTASDSEKSEFDDVVVDYYRSDDSYLIFADNFDIETGWTVNLNGTDNATAGQWKRAVPEATSYSGTTYQLGTVVSGTYDLSTGPLAGSGVGSYDIDNGKTSITSPVISLPQSSQLVMGFSYYLAHYSNSASEDYLTISVVGASSETVLDVRGTNAIKGAAWEKLEVDLGQFAGQDVRIVVEAADAGGGSLIEAGVDDVYIKLSKNGPCNDACAIPSGLYAADVTMEAVTLYWGAVAEASSYMVEYRWGTAGNWLLLAQTPNTEVDLLNLRMGSDYSFRVKSICSDECESEYSAPVLFTTLDCPQPTNIHVVSSSETEVSLSWDNMPDALEYSYYYNAVRPPIVEMENVFVESNSTTITGLKSGTEYEIFLSAVYSYCTSYSSYFSFTTEGCPTPRGVVASNVSETSADIAWDPVQDVSNYEYRYRVSGTTWSGWNSVSTNWTPLSGLTSNTNYQFEVRSICSPDISTPCETYNFSTPGVWECYKPLGLIASNVSETVATVAWDPHMDAMSYEYQYRQAGGGWSEPILTGLNLVNLTGLTPSTEYQVMARSNCEGSNSEWSDVYSFYTEGPTDCPTPTNLIASDITETSAKVAWDPNMQVTSHEYQYRVAGGTWSAWISHGQINVVSLTGLTAGTTYEIIVKADCEGTESLVSDVYSFTTQQDGTPPILTDWTGSLTVQVGEAATLCVTADGTAPLTYEWYHNNNLVQGLNSDCYTAFEEATLADNGTECYVVVSNAYGSVASQIMTISVEEPNLAIIDEDFNTGSNNFSYVDDQFRGTAQPSYASGVHVVDGGPTSDGAVKVDLGGIDNASISGMSGAWRVYFYLSEEKSVSLSLKYNLTMAKDYESSEYCEVLVAMDQTLYGSGSNDYVVRLTGDGNGGSDMTTGWQTFTANLGVLPTGSHWLYIGGYNNRKTYNNEYCSVEFDDVVITGEAAQEPPVITEHPQNLTVGEGEAATFCVMATGSDPLTYEWYRDGQLIAGATSNCYTLSSVSSADNGALFYAVVSNAYGSEVAATAVLTVSAGTVTLIDENFDVHSGVFAYSDDLFRSTNQPAYASGTQLDGAGYSGGAIQVALGGIDGADINNMSAGWHASVTLDNASQVTLTLRYKLTQTPDYESNEYSEMLVSVDNNLIGSGSNDYLARVAGNGNGGSEETTGWQYVELDCGVLAAGTHVVRIGGFNNLKTYSNESTEVLIDDVTLTAQAQ